MEYRVGPKIKFYREKQQLSQKELGELLGVSNARVSNWEKGLNRPDVDMLSSICNVLKISADELLDINSSEDYTFFEKKLIESYRNKLELQPAIDILLDLAPYKK